MINYKPMNHEQRANVGRLIYEAKFASPDAEWVGLGKKYGISAGYAYKLARDHAQSNSLPWTVMANGKPAFPGSKRKAVRQCRTIVATEIETKEPPTLLSLLKAQADQYRREIVDLDREADRLAVKRGRANTALCAALVLMEALKAP